MIVPGPWSSGELPPTPTIHRRSFSTRGMKDMPHHLKEESEGEQQVAWVLNLTDFILQRDIILIQWTTFMRQL